MAAVVWKGGRPVWERWPNSGLPSELQHFLVTLTGAWSVSPSLPHLSPQPPHCPSYNKAALFISGQAAGCEFTGSADTLLQWPSSMDSLLFTLLCSNACQRISERDKNFYRCWLWAIAPTPVMHPPPPSLNSNFWGSMLWHWFIRCSHGCIWRGNQHDLGVHSKTSVFLQDKMEISYSRCVEPLKNSYHTM